MPTKAPHPPTERGPRIRRTLGITWQALRSRRETSAAQLILSVVDVDEALLRAPEQSASPTKRHSVVRRRDARILLPKEETIQQKSHGSYDKCVDAFYVGIPVRGEVAAVTSVHTASALGIDQCRLASRDE